MIETWELWFFSDFSVDILSRSFFFLIHLLVYLLFNVIFYIFLWSFRSAVVDCKMKDFF